MMEMKQRKGASLRSPCGWSYKGLREIDTEKKWSLKKPGKLGAKST